MKGFLALWRRQKLSIDLLRNSGFVDFWDYFDRFSILFRGVISTLRILPPEIKLKIGSKEPEKSTEPELRKRSIEITDVRRQSAEFPRLQVP